MAAPQGMVVLLREAGGFWFPSSCLEKFKVQSSRFKGKGRHELFMNPGEPKAHE